ncbi:MAG: hypothetical protein EXS31_07425 [Pedosphaera sp.]|nr:hypothetical protein [Pedosphaera sp.]
MQISSIQTGNVKAAGMPLEQLAGNKHVSEKEKVSEVARQFEAVLLRQILTAARKSVIKSSINPESATSSIYQDMINESIADNISRSKAFGLATSLEGQLTHQTIKTPSSPGTAQTLAAPTEAKRYKVKHD